MIGIPAIKEHLQQTLLTLRASAPGLTTIHVHVRGGDLENVLGQVLGNVQRDRW